MKKIACLVLAAAALFATADAAFAQLVRPRWNYAGSAVCPDYYDYYQGWCHPRAAVERRPRRERYRGGVQPQWNQLGSAVCPEQFDYYADVGLCLPRF